MPARGLFPLAGGATYAYLSDAASFDGDSFFGGGMLGAPLFGGVCCADGVFAEGLAGGTLLAAGAAWSLGCCPAT